MNEILRIKSLRAQPELELLVIFDDGSKYIYDIKKDLPLYPAFRKLAQDRELFEAVKLDESGTCIYWDEDTDIPSDWVLEYGKQVTT